MVEYHVEDPFEFNKEHTEKTHSACDHGYAQQHASFREIGERIGGFDLAILEAGQYGAYWPHIHMLPEHTVQAAHDLQAAALLRVHWVKRVLHHAHTTGMRVATL